ncbi:MAG: hypothetical protein COV29_01755 [Candidatus Yanofskybacteria bacterium CG10_big_fil_rev_8_21_14_0_10_36_16]|uniref:Uncharacterized protein n=1 Tax=Candidatus Yanofskybacteria bacterium CG10_big_fil_rev_8_21_14_0_10_36_16 TaxID=1975096 RepID=A0A2J0Q7N2_9BACT|nr:MAG: hypothetical protein COV29_01755 [Candidatus Yanofskybacteria bacterium CG10_big_fil_rev_8_21_14_0_10_36_16]
MTETRMNEIFFNNFDGERELNEALILSYKEAGKELLEGIIKNSNLNLSAKDKAMMHKMIDAKATILFLETILMLNACDLPEEILRKIISDLSLLCDYWEEGINYIYDNYDSLNASPSFKEDFPKERIDDIKSEVLISINTMRGNIKKCQTSSLGNLAVDTSVVAAMSYGFVWVIDLILGTDLAYEFAVKMNSFLESLRRNQNMILSMD